MKANTVRALVIGLAALGAVAGVYGYAVKHQLMGLVYCAVCGLIIGIAWRTKTTK